jgi:ppGpp synthetase/RelA/SpoT-type nucleotidyltranferase
MTNKELKDYENELYIIKANLQALSLKGSMMSKSDVSQIQKYAKRMKQIQKILKKAKKETLKNESKEIYS